MASENKPEPRIIVDEDWKSKVEAEREQLRSAEHAGEPPAAAAAAPSGESPKPQAAPERLPPATFLTLVETLAMQAMASLADIARPPEKDEPPRSPDEIAFQIAMAKHLIDTLGVLDEKTRGNLNAEEAGHLEHVLHDLRMAFVSLSSRAT